MKHLQKCFNFSLLEIFYLFNVFFFIFVFGASSVWATAYSEKVLADNPVAYWQFNETSGITLSDSANSNNATLVNGPLLDQPGAPFIGMDGKAVFFDGINDFANLMSNTPFRQSSAITYEFWVKRSGVGGSDIAGVSVSNGQGSGGVNINGTHLQFKWTPSNPVSDRFFINDVAQNFAVGEWNHIVIGVDFANSSSTVITARMHVNGVFVSGSVSSFPIDWTPDTSFNNSVAFLPDMIGGRYVNSFTYFGGTIDEMAIYDKLLTAGQIANHFESVSATSFVFGGGPEVLNGGEVTFTAVTAAGEIIATHTTPSSAAQANLDADNWHLLPGSEDPDLLYYDFTSTATYPDGDRTLTFKVNPSTIPFGLATSDIRGVHVHDNDTFHILDGTFTGGVNTFEFTHDGGFSGYGVAVNPEPATLLLLVSALLGFFPFQKKFLK